MKLMVLCHFVSYYCTILSKHKVALIKLPLLFYYLLVFEEITDPNGGNDNQYNKNNFCC
jgi:hypothetical protein